MAEDTKISSQRALIRSFDEATNSLKTTLVNAEVAISVDALTDSIKIGDGVDTATVSDLGGGVKALDVVVQDITISHSNDSIRLGDGSNLVGVTSTALNVYPVGVVEVEPPADVSLVDEASATITYAGFAPPGTATSAAAWRIKRISVSGSVTSVLFADGDANYNNVWDNRAALSYS